MLQTGMADPPQHQHIVTGCEVCDYTGYKGRVGIYEMLTFDEPIRAVIRSDGRSDEIRALARNSGMKLMQEYALDRVRQGLTTLDEVQRVVPFEAIHATFCSACQRELSPAFLFCPFCGEKKTGTNNPPQSSLVEQGATEQ
jgi:type IV pilus assembly protein PilB